MTITATATGLKILRPGMTRAQTAELEKQLKDGEIRAWEIDTAYWIHEALADVRQDRVTLGHAPSAAEKALAPRITAAIRQAACSPKVTVRTTALGGGQFRVYLPSSTAAYAGIDSTDCTWALESLEQAAGATITVTSVKVSSGDSTWFRTVLLTATPKASS